MNLSLELALGIVGIVIALGVGVLAWLRPEALRAEYEKDLAALRVELRETKTKLETVETRLRELATEYLRIVGENHWLRLQLRAHRIDIPPLPEDLRPHMDANGNISIAITKAGVLVGGGKLDIGGDLVGGDSK